MLDNCLSFCIIVAKDNFNKEEMNMSSLVTIRDESKIIFQFIGTLFVADEVIIKSLLSMKAHSIRITFHGQSGIGNRLTVKRNGVYF